MVYFADQPEYQFAEQKVCLRSVVLEGYEFGTCEKSLLSQGFLYDFRLLISVARSQGKSLDQLLTAYLAQGFRRWAPKSPVLVSSSRFLNQFRVRLHTKRRISAEWLCDLPAYLTNGGEHVPINPGWIGYWDGGKYYRTYVASGSLHNAPYWIQDFGAERPCVMLCSIQRYQQIARDPINHCSFTAVPHSKVLALSGPNGRITVNQARLVIE